jgi:malate synthase
VLPVDGDPRRARLHFVGFNTGRWDYINSVSDAMAWDPTFVNPNIDAITMTYGYMRDYEDRVRAPSTRPTQRAASRCGRAAWSRTSRSARRRRRERHEARRAGAEREQREARAANGSRTGRWCTSSGPCGTKSARPISSVDRSRADAYTSRC